MCQSCEVLYINGVKCHEHGCPDAWRDYERECKWCGGGYTPESPDQDFCSQGCAYAYFNLPDSEEAVPSEG